MDAHPSTKTTPHARHDQPGRPPTAAGSDLSMSTLAIAAAASAVAAFVTSQVWAGGTLATAALSPVIVALVKEGIARPAKRVKTVRLVRGGRVADVDIPGDVADRLDAGPERPIPASFTREAEDLTPVTVYGSDRGSRFNRTRVRIALLTGLLAFGIVVAVFTLPELVAGSSIGGGGSHRTTLFGGTPAKPRHTSKKSESAKATPTATAQSSPTPGATPTVTATATATPTVAATASPAPGATTAPTVPAAPTPTP
ncbi:MAG: hypothetical protein QOE86_2992 [Solirubrobacteraceae bacterium]|jgi:hypothetical protein|nr:hypothetical protein [Solirubrobacteraceae bacterium]